MLKTCQMLIEKLICDLRSNERCLGIGEKKGYHVFIYHCHLLITSSLRGFITNRHDDQLPGGLLAQLAEHCTVTAEVMGSNPL